jgi:hypothetical protein
MVRAVGVMGAVSALVGGITFAQLTSNTVALSPNTLSTRSGGSGGGGNSLQIGAVSNNNNNGGNNNGNNGFGGNNSNNTNNNGGNNNNGFNNNSGNNNGGNNNFNNNNNNNTCTNTTSGSIRGFNLTGSNSLQPGVTSSPIGFCLRNTTNSPMALTVAIPDNPFRNVSSNGLQPNDVTLRITCNNGGSSTDTLDDYVTANNSSAKTLGSLSANRSTNCQTPVRLNNNANTSGSQTLPSFDIEFTGTTTS